MRVLTTQLYFNPNEIEWKLNHSQKNPGVAAAWFRLEDWPNPEALYKLLIKELSVDGALVSTAPEEPVNIFFDLTELWLQGVTGRQGVNLLTSSERQIRHNNEYITKFLLGSDVVLEQSPPFGEQLEKLLKLSPGGAIGTFLGYHGVPEGHELYLWIAIPLGIIVIGSATGIGKGLHNGLNH